MCPNQSFVVCEEAQVSSAQALLWSLPKTHYHIGLVQLAIQMLLSRGTTQIL
jgi:hypothetical protein